jgi:uncharacterized OB-fold protein
MTAPCETSPYAAYAEHCRRSELAYQVRVTDGAPVFHPRLVAPGQVASGLEWRLSAGLGTVYATTTLHRKGENGYNVALVDLDEGFRMMSCVEGVPPDAVRIGMRVRVAFAKAPDATPYPVFVPVDMDGDRPR